MPQINARVHLPLQSGSDPILRRMNRKYTMEQFNEKVDLIHRYLPQWAITTDIIVGFPGEREDGFPRDPGLHQDRHLRECVYVHLFAAARDARCALGTGAGRDRKRAIRTVGAGSKRRITRVPRAQDRYDRSRAHPGAFEKRRDKLAAKTPENATIIAPMPPDYDEALYAREPWLDVEIHEGFIWGCMGTIVRRAPRFTDAGLSVQRPVIDLISA